MAIRKLFGVVLFFVAATAWTVRWYLDGTQAFASSPAAIETPSPSTPGIDGRDPVGAWRAMLVAPVDPASESIQPPIHSVGSAGSLPDAKPYERF
jgi:hypothetical protein